MSYASVLWIGVIVALVVGVGAAVLGDFLRRKDFRDQVSGRKPERRMDPKAKFSCDRPEQENSQISIDREVLRTKSGQNLLGPR